MWGAWAELSRVVVEVTPPSGGMMFTFMQHVESGDFVSRYFCLCVWLWHLTWTRRAHSTCERQHWQEYFYSAPSCHRSPFPASFTGSSPACSSFGISLRHERSNAQHDGGNRNSERTQFSLSSSSPPLLFFLILSFPLFSSPHCEFIHSFRAVACHILRSYRSPQNEIGNIRSAKVHRKKKRTTKKLHSPQKYYQTKDWVGWGDIGEGSMGIGVCPLAKLACSNVSW